MNDDLKLTKEPVTKAWYLWHVSCLSLCAPCHLRSIATNGTSPSARTERKLSCSCFVLFREGTHNCHLKFH